MTSYCNRHSITTQIRLCIFAIIGIAVAGCATDAAKKVERSFYYWKTMVSPSAFEKNKLDSLQVNTLYLKFFDVVWDAFEKQATPVAKIAVKDTAWLHQKNIIPVVFITNETMATIDSTAIEKLAANITQLIQKYSSLYRFQPIQEIQIDCDWTAGTKEKYFQLLRRLQKENADKTLSATIRLHQVKYRIASGVPPVKRGLLMCYNMGDFRQPSTINSIITTTDFAKYAASISSYPLPLDAGLPLFSWYILFRNNQYAGLVQGLPDSVVSSYNVVKKSNGYEVLKEIVLPHRTLLKGDFLKYESSEYPTIVQVAALLNKKLGSKPLRVSFYHMDSLVLNKFSVYEMENIYSRFR